MNLFEAFDDELEQISEERSKLPAALAAGALGAGGVIAHARHKKVLADRARLARNNKLLRAAPVAALVAGGAISKALKAAESRRLKKAFEGAEEAIKELQRSSGKAPYVREVPRNTPHRETTIEDLVQQSRFRRAYENNKKQEAAALRRSQLNRPS